MRARSEHGPVPTEGQLMQLDEQHAIAIYRREGTCWVAEFRGGTGVLVEASSWFHFDVGELRHSHGRRAAALRSATALTPEISKKIECLHRQADPKNTRIAARAAAALGTAQHYWIDVTTALRRVRSTRA